MQQSTSTLPAYRFARALVRPPLMAATRRQWEGQERIPRTGGVVITANHISQLDPFYVAHFVNDSGRVPSFLGKKEVFDIPVAGRVLRAAGQIPVHRNTPRAADAFREAVQAVRGGGAVVVYPEGTLTHDPLGWPMTGKTGAARIALETGAPVVPVGVWLPRHTAPAITHERDESLGERAQRARKQPPRLGRARVRVRAGQPVDLDDLRDGSLGREALEEATARIMDAITREVAVLRAQPAPSTIYDRRSGTRVPRGGR